MNCSTCFFGRRPNSEFKGKCFRYPSTEDKAPIDWCGEWKEINVNKAKPTLKLK